MKKNHDHLSDPADLRRRAEARLSQSRATADPAHQTADTQRLIHELQVHQIELEMQNEALRTARDAMETGMEKYCDLFDFAPVGYLTLDQEGTILEANLAAASLLGLERSRLIHQRFESHVTAADRARFTTLIENTFLTKTRGFCELTLDSGQRSPLAVRIGASLDTSAQKCRVVLIDLSERNRAEEDRQILNKLESTGILAGGIAHDFNNLLTVILLDIELVQSLSKSNGGAAPPLVEAKKAALSAQHLTQQLITFAKGGALVRQSTALIPIIEESARLPLSGSRVECELSLPENLWTADVDAGQIGQVIRNLVLNAREAMPEGGVIAIGAENLAANAEGEEPVRSGDCVRISVVDQGTGIDEELRTRIFDPYFSTKQRGTERGTGLGLTICHAIVNKHGGAIHVTSETGRGTTFHIDLPTTRKPPGPPSVGAAEKPAPPGRILVMDDDDAVRKLIGLTLRLAGHQVELVADGQEAIAAYHTAKGEGRPFDLVLLDLTVRNGLGGQDAVERLRELDPNVQAIVMSGYSDQPAMSAPGEHGFAGVLTKPFAVDRLRAMVTRLMRTAVGRKAAS